VPSIYTEREKERHYEYVIFFFCSVDSYYYYYWYYYITYVYKYIYIYTYICIYIYPLRQGAFASSLSPSLSRPLRLAVANGRSFYPISCHTKPGLLDR